MKTSIPTLLLSIAILSGSAAASAQSTSDIAQMKQELTAVKKTRQLEKDHLANFDDLDFNVYSGQRWDQLHKSHAQDIVVHYPDGSTTKGLGPHIEQLKPMFVFAPDTRIKEHPIRIANGAWTAVQGTLEGTFSRPMPTGGGQTIAPTNKPFKLTMVTIGHWKNGVMDEEWLSWDNQAFMKQIGLAQ